MWSLRPTSRCSLRRSCLLCSLVSRASTCCGTTSATCSRASCSARSSMRRARSCTARSPRGPDLVTLHFYCSPLFVNCLNTIMRSALLPPILFSRLCSFNKFISSIATTFVCHYKIEFYMEYLIMMTDHHRDIKMTNWHSLRPTVRVPLKFTRVTWHAQSTKLYRCQELANKIYIFLNYTRILIIRRSEICV